MGAIEKRLAQALGGVVRRLRKVITAADLTDAALSQTFVVGTMPARSASPFQCVVVSEGFDLNTPLLDVGSQAGSGDELYDDLDLSSPAPFPSNFGGGSTGFGDTIVATVHALNNVNLATTGRVVVDILFFDIDTMPVVPLEGGHNDAP